jgi:hypothetical protein
MTSGDHVNLGWNGLFCFVIKISEIHGGCKKDWRIQEDALLIWLFSIKKKKQWMQQHTVFGFIKNEGKRKNWRGNWLTIYIYRSVLYLFLLCVVYLLLLFVISFFLGVTLGVGRNFQDSIPPFARCYVGRMTGSVGDVCSDQW